MRINFVAMGRTTPEEGARNIAYARNLGLPYFTEGRGLGPLAVVAGGPSIKHHEDEIRAWPYALWGVNDAYEWMYQHGIRSTFFTLDPPDRVNHYPRDTKAIVASSCPPQMFDDLRGCDVTLLDVNCPGGISTGATSVTAVPILAPRLGYSSVVFYGCEGSFEKEHTHAYPYAPLPDLLIIECNGKAFASTAGYLMQTEYLSRMIRLAPHVYSERSGGFLSAMVADQDYDIVGIGADLRDKLRSTEAA